jgi:hypothetical protein
LRADFANIEQLTEKEVPEEQTIENGEAANSSIISTAVSPDADREIKALKAILAQQSRQISALTETVGELVEQMKTLKTS